MYNIFETKMISKYLFWTSVVTVNIFLLSSCLGSGSDDYEYPVDPQIYAISIASETDSTNQLASLSFTIDQIKGEIYNKEPLPYLFHVDSVMLTITGPSNYYSFAGIQLTLADDPETPFFWNMTDSIDINKLLSIETYAPDAVTSKKYNFQLNIYQEDPDSIQWERIKTDYPTSSVIEQKTVAIDNHFITYYRLATDAAIKAVSAPIADAPVWEPVSSQSWIPGTIQLSSLINVGNSLYVLDETGLVVFKSEDGKQWLDLSTGNKIHALYGKLPFSTSGDLLIAVEDAGSLKFAQANSDFSTITLLNAIPDKIPITGFSSLNIMGSNSYATQFILLSGGTTAINTSNEDIWLLQDNGNNVIGSITGNRPEDANLKGSSLFFYDDKPFLITTNASGVNILFHSDDNGLHWSSIEEKNAFPTEPIAFSGRTHASVITDSDNYIWIFGGISYTNPNTWLTDVWRGRLNKFSLN